MTTPLTRRSQCLVILEFALNALPTLRKYAYLVFIEPVFLSDKTDAATLIRSPVHVLVRRTGSGLSTGARVVDTMPDLESSTSVAGEPKGACNGLPSREFPVDSPSPFEGDESIDFSSFFDWARLRFGPASVDGLSPKLIISDVELEWQAYRG